MASSQENQSIQSLSLMESAQLVSIASALKMKSLIQQSRARRLADTADAENYNAIKLKIWTRMWIAGKRKPKKYGDNAKLALTGADGEGPVELSVAISEARKRAGKSE
ncbi:MAG: hypothetical protein ABSE82_17290 [Nitrososphaerales archaeon]